MAKPQRVGDKLTAAAAHMHPGMELHVQLHPAGDDLGMSITADGRPVVATVDGGSAAAMAGMQAQDVIQEFAGMPVTCAQDLQAALGAWRRDRPRPRGGGSVRLVVLRNLDTGQPTSPGPLPNEEGRRRVELQEKRAGLSNCETECQTIAAACRAAHHKIVQTQAFQDELLSELSHLSAQANHLRTYQVPEVPSPPPPPPLPFDHTDEAIDGIKDEALRVLPQAMPMPARLGCPDMQFQYTELSTEHEALQ
eukprot:gene3771-4172_t